ncbi:MAG: UvrD-helicase domain-containing protein [Chloroflexi bacterium]|nr:UvrD-helicase domain-containing protein [Chloroflexota bacterium]
MTMTPSDQAARDRITGDLATTLVVEAGAGTGKTHSFVQRIESLVLNEGVRIEEIVAITFTRAAAAELRERIRAMLEAVARDSQRPPEQHEAAQNALDGLDRAAIQTIHSFAQSLVQERAVDAGLPLVIEPLDGVDAGIEFDSRFSVWVDKILDDPELGEVIVNAVRLGFEPPIGRLRELAAAFHNEYHRIKPLDLSLNTNQVRIVAKQIISARSEIEGLLQYSQLREEDKLFQHAQKVIELARGLERLDTESDAPLAVLARVGGLKENGGRQADWDKTPDGVNAAKLLKDLFKELDETAREELEQARSAALVPILDAARTFVLDYAEDRRRTGRAEFNDLLVWARDLLKGSANAQTYFAERYKRILIDEFQDTDPLQLEIAALLAGISERGAQARSGALFVVGDPKQSIYRFRRADPKVIGELPTTIGAETVFLKHTFRSNSGIVNWVNELFEKWMGHETTPTQSGYESLTTSINPDGSGHPQGVYGISAEEELPNAFAAREAEARRIASMALAVGAGRWRVTSDPKSGETRPSTFKDMAIIFPGRTGLETLTQALEDTGVPYSLEGQSLLFASQEIRDLIAALKAIDDPTDEIAAVAALRSPLFGCSDVELYRWVDTGNRFNHLEAVLDNESLSVADGLATLREMHELRQAISVPALIEMLATRRDVRQVALRSRMSRERHRQLEAFIESARTLAGGGLHTLRQFIRWAEERAESGDRMPEGGIADIGNDAVRLMTTFHAKGLEFPIVTMTGLLRSASGSGGGSLLFDDKNEAMAGIQIGNASARFEFGPYELLDGLEKNASADELIRVAYVGATRAKDYLVVSMYRPSKDKSSLAARIDEVMNGSPLWSELPDFGRVERQDAPVATPDFGSEADFSVWEAERKRVLNCASLGRTISATSLKEAGSAAPYTEDVKPVSPSVVEHPWRKGRGASEVGRAVHAVLQDIDLSSGDGIDAAAQLHAVAEGVGDRSGEVANLARSTLQVPVVQRAAQFNKHFREAYVGVPVVEGESGLEGFIDLAFEDENGDLVIIDFKTDRVGDGDVLAEASAPYRMQLGVYAHAIAQATGLRVSEAWLVFSRRALDGEEAEYRFEDIDDAAREAAELAATLVGGT